MLNVVVLTGRLTADPELKSTQSGVSVCSFCIAVERRYKSGEDRVSDFINIVSWRSSAEFVSKYFKKGQQIIIEGSMQTEEWEKDGEKKSRTICTIEKADFCGNKSDNAGNTNNNSKVDADGFMNIPDEIADEELPFN